MHSNLTRRNLIKLRKIKSYTQKELAKVLGITERQYRRLEAGTSGGNMKRWQYLAKLFDTTVDHLLEQTEDGHASP